MRYAQLGLIGGLAVFFSAFLFEAPAAAVTRLTDDFTELFRTAGLIAEVEVLELAPHASADGAPPSTLVKIKLHKVYKGSEAAGSVIEARILGGIQGDLQVISPGQPVLNVGDRAVLMLAKMTSADSTWRVVAGEAGQVRVGRNADGQLVAQRAAGRFEYYVPAQGSASGFRQVTAEAVTMECLESLLKTLATTGKPVFETAVHAVAAPAATVKALPKAQSQSSPLQTVPALGAPVMVEEEAPATSPFLGKLLIVLGAVTAVWWIARRVRAARAA